MEPNNTSPTSTMSPVASGESPTPEVSVNPSSPVVSGSGKSGGSGGKRQLIMILLLVVIVVILGALGYYYYAYVMNKSANKISAVPTVVPKVTVVPTEAIDPIKDSSELDGVVEELDNASEEASMSQEVNGLKTDSNF